MRHRSNPATARRHQTALAILRGAVVAGALAASACGGGSSPTAPSGGGSGGSGGTTGSLQPTFTSISSQVFQARCVTCHNATNTNAGLNLSSGAAYANLVNVASSERPTVLRVAPGNPDASYLVHKLEGNPSIVGSRMPLSGTPLSGDDIQVIRTWIAQGAQNN